MSAEVKHSASKIFLSAASFSSTNKNITKLSNSRMVFKIEPFILHNDDPYVFVLGMEQASIPMCFNVINSNNNTFAMGYGAPSVTITIPVGNYNVESLVDAMNAQAAAAFFVGYNSEPFFSFNYDTNRIQANPSVANLIIATSGSSTAYEQLGFSSSGDVWGSTAPPNKRGFTNVVNLTTTNGIVVRLNGINTNNRDTKGDGGGASVIARLPINSNSMTYLQYFNPVVFYLTLSNRVITQFDVELLDDAYQPLQFQIEKPDWFIVLKLDYVEKKPNLIPMTKIQKLKEGAIVPPLQPLTPKDESVVSPFTKK